MPPGATKRDSNERTSKHVIVAQLNAYTRLEHFMPFRLSIRNNSRSD